MKKYLLRLLVLKFVAHAEKKGWLKDLSLETHEVVNFLLAILNGDDIHPHDRFRAIELKTIIEKAIFG